MERYSIPGVRTKLALNRMLIVLKDESGMRYFEAGASGNNPYPLVIAQTSLKEIEGEEFRFHLSDNLKEKFNAELVGIELFNKLDNDLSNNANLPRRIKI